MAFREVSGIVIKEQADTVLLERKEVITSTHHTQFAFNACLLFRVRFHVLETVKCISESLCLTLRCTKSEIQQHGFAPLLAKPNPQRDDLTAA